MAKLEVSVNKAKSGNFEGTVSIPGLAPTKLAVKKTGATEFASKAALSTVARSVAKNLGFESAELISEMVLETTKKAAKANKSVKGDA